MTDVTCEPHLRLHTLYVMLCLLTQYVSFEQMQEKMRKMEENVAQQMVKIQSQIDTLQNENSLLKDELNHLKDGIAEVCYL